MGGKRRNCIHVHVSTLKEKKNVGLFGFSLKYFERDVLSVTIIAVRNRIGDWIEAVYVSLCANALGKGINPALFFSLPRYVWIAVLTGFYSIG